MPIIVSIFVCLLFSAACYAGQLPRGFAAQYAAILKQVLQADHEMYLQMEVTAKKLAEFYANTGHFPDSEPERERFRKVLGKYIVGNPYHPQIVDQIEHKTVVEQYHVPLYWLQDTLLTKKDFVNFLRHPDPSWQGEPGTIFILTNGKNVFLVFASSADRLPIRDFRTNEQLPRMICQEITPKESR